MLSIYEEVNKVLEMKVVDFIHTEIDFPLMIVDYVGIVNSRQNIISKKLSLRNLPGAPPGFPSDPQF